MKANLWPMDVDEEKKKGDPGLFSGLGDAEDPLRGEWLVIFTGRLWEDAAAESAALLDSFF